MGNPLFNGRFLLNNAIDVGNGYWDIEGVFTDGESVFLATDILTNDILIIDTSAYMNGTVTQYKVTQIVSANATNFVGRILFDDNNTSQPDLSYSIGMFGIITRATSNESYIIVASPDAQAVSDRLSFYPINRNTQAIDALGSGPQGAQGAQGAQGVAGSSGSDGTQGYQGVAGADGTQGYQGVAGSGNQGVQGVQGYQGNDGAGTQGERGYQGYQGSVSGNIDGGLPSTVFVNILYVDGGRP